MRPRPYTCVCAYCGKTFRRRDEERRRYLTRPVKKRGKKQ
jgi:hypothetical protein